MLWKARGRHRGLRFALSRTRPRSNRFHGNADLSLLFTLKKPWHSFGEKRVAYEFNILVAELGI